jgi:hypothetical protein
MRILRLIALALIMMLAGGSFWWLFHNTSGLPDLHALGQLAPQQPATVNMQFCGHRARVEAIPISDLGLVKAAVFTVREPDSRSFLKSEFERLLGRGTGQYSPTLAWKLTRLQFCELHGTDFDKQKAALRLAIQIDRTYSKISSSRST